MDIVLIHLGPQIPSYLFQCIRQIRNVTDDRIIIAFSEQKNFIVREENVVTVCLESISKCENWRRFNHSHFSQMGLDLWRYACERFYAIETLMDELKLGNILHIENDNLIYAKPDVEFFENNYDGCIAITQITETLLGAGIMYVDNIDALYDMNKALNRLIDLGHKGLVEKYGGEMLNEMRLLKIVHDEHPELIKLLPIFPDEKSKYVYDCASWGQFIGGTYHSPGVSYHDDSHLIGREINRSKYEISWCSGHNKAPMVMDVSSGNCKQLFNLHIHSKELDKWMSK